MVQQAKKKQNMHSQGVIMKISSIRLSCTENEPNEDCRLRLEYILCVFVCICMYLPLELI